MSETSDNAGLGIEFWTKREREVLTWSDINGLRAFCNAFMLGLMCRLYEITAPFMSNL